MCSCVISTSEESKFCLHCVRITYFSCIMMTTSSYSIRIDCLDITIIIHWTVSSRYRKLEGLDMMVGNQRQLFFGIGINLILRFLKCCETKGCKCCDMSRVNNEKMTTMTNHIYHQRIPTKAHSTQHTLTISFPFTTIS